MSNFDILNNVNVAALDDMTEVKSGGGSRGLLPTGTALVRLSGYVEFGNFIQEFQGQKKPAARMFQLSFRIVGGVGINAEGKPEKYVGEDGYFPMATTFDTPISFHEKSKAVKYFNALNRVGAKATHFVQKLQEQCVYAMPVSVYTSKKNGKQYNKFDFDNLQMALDQETGLPREAPELKPEDIQVFLWEQPTKAMWDSIHIEGEYDEQKDDKGNVTKPKRSKNFLQEKCLQALDFEGSALQAMLGGDVPSLPTTPDAPETPETPDVPDVPAAPEEDSTETSAGSVPSVPEVPTLD